MFIRSPFHTTVSGGTPARPSSSTGTPSWLLATAVAVVCGSAMAVEKLPIEELDAFWSGLSRSVTTGDFEACVACYHPDGVLVSEAKERSEPITAALARWKQDFADTRGGTMKAEVVTRFTRRLGDATTAHETGISGTPPRRQARSRRLITCRLSRCA